MKPSTPFRELAYESESWLMIPATLRRRISGIFAFIMITYDTLYHCCEDRILLGVETIIWSNQGRRLGTDSGTGQEGFGGISA